MLILMSFCKNTHELKFEQVIVIFYNEIYTSSIDHKIAQNFEKLQGLNNYNLPKF